MYKLIIPMVLALMSVVFLGSGITGFAVSESCCEGPDCQPEEKCSLPANERQVTGTTSIVLSAACLVASMLVYVLLNRGRKKK